MSRNTARDPGSLINLWQECSGLLVPLSQGGSWKCGDVGQSEHPSSRIRVPSAVPGTGVQVRDDALHRRRAPTRFRRRRGESIDARSGPGFSGDVQNRRHARAPQSRALLAREVQAVAGASRRQSARLSGFHGAEANRPESSCGFVTQFRPDATRNEDDLRTKVTKLQWLGRTFQHY